MTLRVKIIPRSSRNEFAGELSDGTLKIKIAAPPEKGKANEALCEFLARHYGVPKANVKVVSGHTSPLKLVRVTPAR
jgi:uncharacterized protein (TIGR00251 family)